MTGAVTGRLERSAVEHGFQAVFAKPLQRRALDDLLDCPAR
jgi:hypothetical protein